MKHSISTGGDQEFLNLTAETLKEAAELLETSKGIYSRKDETPGSLFVVEIRLNCDSTYLSFES